MRQAHMVGLLFLEELSGHVTHDGKDLCEKENSVCDPWCVTCVEEQCVTQVGRSGKPPPHFLLEPRTTCCCHFLKSQDSSAGCGVET